MSPRSCILLSALLGLFPAVSFARKLSAGRVQRECAASYQKAQALEVSGHLRAALGALIGCSKASCGKSLQHQCSSGHEQLDAEIPSIVVVAADESGAPIIDVEVKMDGELLTSRLDGRPLRVDPGLHEFSFQPAGGQALGERIMIVQGQRNRPVSVSLHVSPSAPAPSVAPTSPPRARDPEPVTDPVVDPAVDPVVDPNPRPAPSLAPSIASYVLGASGLLAVGTGAVLTFWGRKDNGLLSECSPRCKPESIDHIRKLYLGADIAFGIGAAALLSSVVLYVIDLYYGVTIEPTTTGAVASVAGRF